ncbi:hypothetical protein CGC20_15745 [Leishmania donovani]|uniref:Membrane-associated protein n=2 Tax=Leishmania donovani TaxID=5661 RepID=A0A504XUQ8_LEIDO|nr:hypothetical protein CGC20_15745 [Leishmania donovani]
MHLQLLWCSASLPSMMAVLLALAMCLAASIASADMLLAPSDSIPFTTFGQLQQVCAATQAGSTPVAMYTATMTALVANLMSEKKVTHAYVSAYLNADRRWTWFVYEGGEVIETLMNSSQWATGNPTGAHTTYRHVVYSTTDKGLISATGYDNYPVVCKYENQTDYSPPGKRFPWWSILIVVVVVAVVVTVAVCCLCCKRKQFDDAGDEDSELTTHNGSFRSYGTSHTDSNKSDGSSLFTSRRSSSSGSESQSDGSSS